MLEEPWFSQTVACSHAGLTGHDTDFVLYAYILLGLLCVFSLFTFTQNYHQRFKL